MAFHDPPRRAMGGTTSVQDPWPLAWAVVAGCPRHSASSPELSLRRVYPEFRVSSGRESNVSTWGDSRPREGISTPAVGPESRPLPFPAPGPRPPPQGPQVTLPSGSRDRPRLRCCHARPSGQTAANPREASTSPSQSTPVLFLGTTRPGLFSWPPPRCR